MSDRAEHLCERAQAGELGAASELVGQFYETIYAYLRRQCGNDSDAADLTQKTFFKVWLSLSSYGGRSSFSTWLHSIARPVLVDWRRPDPETLSQSGDWGEDPATAEPGPAEDTAEREIASQVYSLVEALDNETRETVHLHYYQGLSLNETADVLGIAASTVKYRLRAAIEFLRRRTAQPTPRTAES